MKRLMFRVILFLLLFLSLSFNAYAQAVANYGTTVYSFNLTTNGTGNGTPFAIPQASIGYVSWCPSYGTTPASVTINIQTSNDNSLYSTQDSSTNTAGECKSFFTAAKFIRGNVSAVSGGTTTTLSINIQRVSTANSNINTNVAAIASTLFLGNGTVTAPSLAYTSQQDLGFYRPFSGAIGLVQSGAASLILSNDITRGFEAGSLFPVSWSSSTSATAAADTFLFRGGAGILEQRNVTSAQRLNVYNTYTSSINNELLSIDWQTGANVANFGTRTAATGTSRQLFISSQASSGANNYAGFIVSREVLPFFRIGLYSSGLTPQNSSDINTPMIKLGELTGIQASGNTSIVAITPTYNQVTSTAANTDLLINRTETSLGSGLQYLIDAQVSGASKFNVDNGGNMSVPSGVTSATDYLTSSANGSNGGLTRTFRKVTNKTAIANATATDVFTVTIPNSAQTAGIHVFWTCLLGAGGAIGSSEGASATELNYIVTRTTGANAAVAGSTSTGVGVTNANVVGGATATITSGWSAVSGAVGATNTATIQVTVTRGASTSTNHQCLAEAILTNFNASGITIQ